MHQLLNSLISLASEIRKYYTTSLSEQDFITLCQNGVIFTLMTTIEAFNDYNFVPTVKIIDINGVTKRIDYNSLKVDRHDDVYINRASELYELKKHKSITDFEKIYEIRNPRYVGNAKFIKYVTHIVNFIEHIHATEQYRYSKFVLKYEKMIKDKKESV